MAEVILGDIVARLRVDNTQFEQALTQAQQRLTQLQQGLSQVASQQASASQASQQLTQQYTTLAQALTQQTQALDRAARTAQQYQQSQAAAQQSAQQLAQGATTVAQSVAQQSQAFTQAASAVQQYGQSQGAVSQSAQQVSQSATTAAQAVTQQSQAYTQATRTTQQYTQSQTAAAQAAAQTRQQLSQLPFNAIQNATEAFSRSMQNAGNSQERYRTAIRQAQEALRQFQVTTTASGEMIDRFGNRLSQAATADLRQFQTGVREAQAELRELQRFGINQPTGGVAGGGLLQTALGIAGGLGIVTGLAALARQLKEIATESVTLAAKMQDLNVAFRSIEGSAAGANKTLTFLFETSQRLGVDFERVADGFKRFDQAAKGTTLEGQAVATVFANVLAGARVLGSSSQQVTSAIVALEQVMTKGKLSAEEYRRQLGNAIPGALKFMADGFGVTTRAMEQMIQSGIIPADAAVVAFGNSLGLLGQKGTADVERLSTTFARLKNETTAWFTALGEGIASKLKPFLDTLVTISETLRGIFHIPVPGTQQVPTQMPVTPSPYTEIITRQAQAQQVDPGLLSRLIQAESNFNPQAISSAGARGLGQLMLPTAQGLEMGVTAENLLEPERNIRLAAKYLSEMLDQFKGFPDAVKLALAAYNAGPGSVMAAIKAVRLGEGDVTFERVLARLPRPQETGPYVERIMAAPPAATPTAAPGTPAPGGLDVSKTILATIDKTMQELPELQKQMDALAQSSLNFGGILGEDIRKQAEEVTKKFVQTAELLARFPDLLAKMTPQQREQLDIMTRQVAVFQQRVQDEAQTESGARRRVQELRTLEALEEQFRAQQLTEDTQYAAHTLQVFREREQEVEKNRAALEQLAATYGLTADALDANAEATNRSKQARDAATAADLAASQAGSVYEDQTRKLAQAIAERAAIEAKIPQLRREAAASAREGQEAIDIQARTRTFEQTVADQLERLRLPREERQEERLRAQARKQGVDLTPETEAQLKAISQQERFNQVMEVAGRLGESVSQTLTTGLLSIASGTERVGQAFKNMAKAILDSMAQIAVSEGFKLLIGIGLKALGGALTTTTPTVQGGGTSFASAGGASGGTLGFQHGGIVTKPTYALLGENPAKNPEYVLNREQMQHLVRSAMQVQGATPRLPATLPSGPGVPPAMPAEALFAQAPLQPLLDRVRESLPAVHRAQGGAVVNRPTHMLVGESPAQNPEYVLNRQQMGSLMQSARQAGPSAGGQAAGGITVINVADRTEGERRAAEERAMGRTVVVNYVLDELAQGSGSRIGQVLRAGQR